jgi:hypothetical protein
MIDTNLSGANVGNAHFDNAEMIFNQLSGSQRSEGAVAREFCLTVGLHDLRAKR